MLCFCVIYIPKKIKLCKNKVKLKGIKSVIILNCVIRTYKNEYYIAYSTLLNFIDFLYTKIHIVLVIIRII